MRSEQLTAALRRILTHTPPPPPAPKIEGAYHPEFAHAEGWTISDGDPRCPGDVHVELQRIDAPEQGPPAFADDAEAWAYVVARARQGSALHRQALAMVDPVERLLIEAHCGGWGGGS